MIIFHQITKDDPNLQQQVNGYSPKYCEYQHFIPQKVGGYSPKKRAKLTLFLQVGGYSPKKGAAAAKILPFYIFLICYESIFNAQPG